MAKIQAGFEADVINSCVDEATLEMVQKGMYMPLDVSRLEHWDEIWPSMKELPGVRSTARSTSCRSTPGPRGSCTTPTRSHAARRRGRTCSIRSTRGRASLEDLAITALDVGALANGIPNPLEMTDEQLEQVKQYLMDHREQFRTFWKGRPTSRRSSSRARRDHRVRLPGRREGSCARRGRERAVRAGEGRPDAVDLRVRHQPRHRRGEPRRRLRAAQLVHDPAAADLRGDQLQLPHLEPGHHRQRCRKKIVEEAGA